MYIPLYTYSVYSLLKSSLKLEDYVSYAKEQKISSLALTDECNVYGLIKFYNECTKAGIKPLLGMTVFFDEQMPLILIAKNNVGYRNLLKISTVVQLNGLRLSLDSFKAYSEGFICIIPTENNQFSQLIVNDQRQLFFNFLNNLKFIPKEDLYIGIHPNWSNQNDLIHQKLIEIGAETGIELVALNQIYYYKETDDMLVRYLKAIDKGEKIISPSIPLESQTNYFMDVETFEKGYQLIQKALQNTKKIADKCRVEMDFKKLHLPKYPLKESVSSDDYLKILCKKGLEKRLNTTTLPKLYLERLIYELDVISQMNYSDYFLIVYDFVKFAKQNQIAVGPGRGSAAGSLVSYVLGITNVDPIPFDLLFERFLNPDRITMPDIDLDFQDNRRDEVISYVQKQYGINNVAHILAFGTFASRSAIREIAKVMNISDTRVNELMNHIHANLTLLENIEKSQEIAVMMREFEEIRKLFTIAEAIEGIPRNTTTHAAGIVICEEDLSYLTGLQNGLGEVLQTQFEAKDLEQMGILKMDFLGLRNLTAIQEIIELIKKTEGIELDLNRIPFDDAKTYRLIARGETTGLFQLESNGMRNVLMDLKASAFEDIVAVNALFRPGPMDNIATYVARKNKTQPVEYLHPDLIPILESTYGIIVYQEQIMQIARKIANYSYARADLLRRLVSKKQKDLLMQEKVIFIQEATKNGYDQETSTQLYEYIEKFGDYGFNRSHSVAYSIISYQMAYLKANFVTPFMVVLLKSVIGSVEQSRHYFIDCKRYGIQLLPISINRSFAEYTIESANQIRISYLTIKGLGNNMSDAILKEREKGTFKNYFDFIYRTSKLLRQNIFEALVFVGALDEFHLTRRTMMENYSKITDLTRFNQSGYFTNQIDVEHFPEYPTNELMAKEKKYLGFYLLTHPVPRYLEKHPDSPYVVPSKTLKYLNKNVELIGFIESIRKTITKDNEEMATLILSDDMTTVSGVIFPSAYTVLKGKFSAEDLCVFKCRISERNERLQVIIQDIFVIE